VARKSVDGGAIALVVVGLLVAALAGSWAWSRFGPGAAEGGRRKASARVIRVQVLNGSGEPGIGIRVASYLREGGYRVVEVRNADRGDYFSSLVVARRVDLSLAREVAHYLGGPPLVRQAWDSELADVSVVIGSDRSRLRLEP
jgi:hypothetical protein